MARTFRVTVDTDQTGKCPACKKRFLKRRSDQEFCSTKCRVRAWRDDKKELENG